MRAAQGALLQAARFSALQRAENSQCFGEAPDQRAVCGFSALQRAENSQWVVDWLGGMADYSFSALQRAENSQSSEAMSTPRIFGFSALQRAENSQLRRYGRVWRD